MDISLTWGGVSNSGSARQLLERQYKRLGSIEKMADWFRCQGFEVVRFTPGPFAHVKNAQMRLSTGLILRKNDGKPLWKDHWYTLTPYAQTIELYFDDARRLIAVAVGDTYE